MDEHGDRVCLVHGTQWFAARAWDALEEPPPASKREEAPNSGKRWGTEEKAMVVALRDVQSSRELGLRLFRTEHSVNQYLSKAGLRKARMQNSSVVRKRADTLEQLEDSVRPGLTRRLAARHGLSYDAAYFRLYRRGVLVSDADGMLSIADVCREYGCSRDRVERLIELGTLPCERIGRGCGARVRIDPGDAEIVAPLLRARSKHDRWRVG